MSDMPTFSPEQPGGSGPLRDDSQRIFDTVVGPNLRWKDNLIQLAIILIGAVLGAIAGAVYNQMSGNDPALGAVVGGFFGLVVFLLLSGAILGLIRFITAVKGR